MSPDQTLTPTSFVVAERFNSIQGEGRWTGTPMHFIRLAGCNVGKHPVGLADVPLPLLKTGHIAAQCCTYDGRHFACDTDFFHGTVMSFELLASLTTEHHVVFTGGEPLLHVDRIADFVEAYPKYTYHVETSGTVPLKNLPLNVWITCAPKRDFIPEVIIASDEIKLLVDASFNLDNVPREVLDHELVYVQPVNEELRVDQANLQICYEILRRKPQWHLSVQLHKFLNLR